MLQTAEFQQVLERHAGEVEDLRTIARLHGVPTGTPEHLLNLPLRLAKDSRLRSDLTELVRSLQANDPDLGLPDALAIVLLAIGGAPNLERRRDLEECVDLTGGFLASLGGWPGSEVEPTIDIDNPPDHDPRLDLASATESAALDADPPRLATHKEEVVVASSPAAPSQEAQEASRDPGGTVTLAEITHALARLERGNLELRLHLDSIDQRICRMEPLLETSPHPEPPASPEPQRSSLATDGANLVHRGSAQPSTRSDISPDRDPLDEIKQMRRISLTSNFAEPTPLPVPRSPSGQTTPAPVSRPEIPGSLAEPVSHPRIQPRRDRFAAARELPGNSAETDALYLDLGTAGDPPPTRADQLPAEPEPPSDLLPHVSAALPASPTTTPDLTDPPPVTVPLAPAPAAAAGARERLFRPHPMPEETPVVTPASPSSESFWAASVEEDSQPRGRLGAWAAGLIAAAVVGAAGFLYINGLPSAINDWFGGNGSAVSSDAGTDRSPNAGAAISDGRSATAPNQPASSSSRASSSTSVPGGRETSSPSNSVEKTNGPTFVPGGIMDGYLIAAPRPVYPEMAKLVGAEGKVTFEAMVSKEGQVEAVKVLGGKQALRSAATDAVKQWQYRPFQVKGHPVEVRTIIRVDVGSHAESSTASP